MTDTQSTSLADELADFEKPDLIAMHRSELEAEVVHQAKLIERFRQGVANIVRAVEDEGDRVYFGSSNDFEELRELDEKLTDCGNELFMPWMHGDDLYTTIRELREENEALRITEARTGGDALLRAARVLVDQASDTYRKGNGQIGSIEADDGEKCWIVHDDDMLQLRAAVEALSNPTPADDAGDWESDPKRAHEIENQKVEAELARQRADDAEGDFYAERVKYEERILAVEMENERLKRSLALYGTYHPGDDA